VPVLGLYWADAASIGPVQAQLFLRIIFNLNFSSMDRNRQ